MIDVPFSEDVNHAGEAHFELVAQLLLHLYGVWDCEGESRVVKGGRLGMFSQTTLDKEGCFDRDVMSRLDSSSCIFT